jgi:hypothetical protein
MLHTDILCNEPLHANHSQQSLKSGIEYEARMAQVGVAISEIRY